MQHFTSILTPRAPLGCRRQGPPSAQMERQILSSKRGVSILVQKQGYSTRILAFSLWALLTFSSSRLALVTCPWTMPKSQLTRRRQIAGPTASCSIPRCWPAATTFRATLQKQSKTGSEPFKELLHQVRTLIFFLHLFTTAATESSSSSVCCETISRCQTRET